HPLVHPELGRDSGAHGQDGLSGRAGQLPPPRRELAEHDAVDQLRTVLDNADEPVTNAAIGPLTHIATLLAAHPRLRHKIARIVVMGGALTRGNVTAAAEFNIHSDPEAAHRVLGGGDVDCVLVPLDLTHRCAVGTSWVDELAAADTIGTALTGLTPDYRTHYRTVLASDGIVLHDAVALAEAIRPGMLRPGPFPVAVAGAYGPAGAATVASGRGTAAAVIARAPQGAEDAGTVRAALDTDTAELCRFVLDGLTGKRGLTGKH